MTQKTAEESLQNSISLLGQEYGTNFHYCCQQLWQVSANWDRYETLFGTRERVEILNASSGNFWYTVQAMLHEHVLLGLCRLTDPPRNRHQSNLSVTRLFEVDPTGTKAELKNRVERAKKRTEFAHTWRNKRIAHNDLMHVTGEANTIQSSSGRKISAAIVAIHDVLRWVQGRYFDGDMQLIDIGDSDANATLFALARSKHLSEMQRSYIDSKEYQKALELDVKFPSGDYGRDQRYQVKFPKKRPLPYRGKLPLVC